MKERKSSWRFPIVLLLVLGIAATVYDVWLFVAGTVDPNVHLPFLLEIVFFGGAWAVWHYGGIIDRATPEQLERLRKETDEDSCLNPKNADRGKKPGDIG